MTLAERLANWRRAHLWYAMNGRCFSLEGAFRAKRGQEVEYETGEWIGDGAPTSPLELDPLDAWEVELAWRATTIKTRWVIKLSVIDHQDRGDAQHGDWPARCKCARLVRSMSGANVQPNDWREHVRSAKFELGDVLADMESGRQEVLQQGIKNALQIIRMFGIVPLVDSTMPAKRFAVGAAR